MDPSERHRRHCCVFSISVQFPKLASGAQRTRSRRHARLRDDLFHQIYGLNVKYTGGMDVVVRTIHQLLGEIGKLDKAESLIFRGVPDSDYTLLPSIWRTRHSSIPTQIRPVMESQAVWRFRDQVRPHVHLTLENKLEWLVLAQHHGLPTRLLDWSSSPLVAAYFASSTIEARVKQGRDGRLTTSPIDGAVYVVIRPPKLGPSDRERPFGIKKIKLIDPPHVCERVTRQSARLTIHPNPIPSWPNDALIRYLIPMSQKMQMKFELDHLGINEASLFPGVDAIAKYLKWQLKWDRFK
jgi:FRG domain